MKRLQFRHLPVFVIFLIPMLILAGIILFAPDDTTSQSKMFSFLPYAIQKELLVGKSTLQFSSKGEILQAQMTIKNRAAHSLGSSAIYEITYDRASGEFTETGLSGLGSVLTLDMLETFLNPILDTFSGQGFTVEYLLPPNYNTIPDLPDWPLLYRASLADGTLEQVNASRLSEAQIRHMIKKGRMYLTLEDGSRAFVGLANDHNVPTE